MGADKEPNVPVILVYEKMKNISKVQKSRTLLTLT